MPPRRLFQGFALSVAVGVLGLAMALPPVQAQASAPPAQNALDTLKAAGDFTTFLRAVEHAGLEATLMGPGPMTVLMPSA